MLGLGLASGADEKFDEARPSSKARSKYLMLWSPTPNTFPVSYASDMPQNDVGNY